jgi:hypothetical protein
MHYDGSAQAKQVGTKVNKTVTIRTTQRAPEAQTRKAELVRALRKAADMNPDEFWLWWFMLPKSERRDLLDIMAPEKECAV